MILFLNVEKDSLEVTENRRRKKNTADFEEKRQKKFPKMALKYYCKKIWVWKKTGMCFLAMSSNEPSSTISVFQPRNKFDNIFDLV